AQYEYTRDFLSLAVTSTDAEFAKQQTQTRLKEHLQKLRERYESDLFLFGFYPTENEYLSNDLRLYLFSSFSTRLDVREVHTDQSTEVETLLKQIDGIALNSGDLVTPYIGVTTIDTELAGHSLVALGVDQNSPASRAGIQEGDAIISIGGQPAIS